MTELQAIKEEERPARANVVLQGGKADPPQTKAALLQSLTDGAHAEMANHSFELLTSCLGLRGQFAGIKPGNQELLGRAIQATNFGGKVGKCSARLAMPTP